MLQGLQERGAHTRFCMVRFGNVLESSGSVVPLFREQIRDGGPVTVTHQDVIRYFMTIPEAAQLVIAGRLDGLRAATCSCSTWASPVRIADLAKRMISLMGYTVRDDENPGRRHRNPFHRPASGREVVRRAADRQQRHRHRASDDHARHGALPAVGAGAAGARRPVAVLSRASIAIARAQLLMQTVAEYQPDRRIQDHVWSRKAGSRVSGAVLTR